MDQGMGCVLRLLVGRDGWKWSASVRTYLTRCSQVRRNKPRYYGANNGPEVLENKRVHITFEWAIQFVLEIVVEFYLCFFEVPFVHSSDFVHGKVDTVYGVVSFPKADSCKLQGGQSPR